MNPLDQSLGRLFRAAARAPQSPIGPPTFGWESRLIAGWHSLAAEDDYALWASLFRRAITFAGLVLALSATWNYLENKSAADTVTLANYAMTLQLPQ